MATLAFTFGSWIWPAVASGQQYSWALERTCRAASGRDASVCRGGCYGPWAAVPSDPAAAVPLAGPGAAVRWDVDGCERGAYAIGFEYRLPDAVAAAAVWLVVNGVTRQSLTVPATPAFAATPPIVVELHGDVNSVQLMAEGAWGEVRRLVVAAPVADALQLVCGFAEVAGAEVLCEGLLGGVTGWVLHRAADPLRVGGAAITGPNGAPFVYAAGAAAMTSLRGTFARVRFKYLRVGAGPGLRVEGRTGAGPFERLWEAGAPPNASWVDAVIEPVYPVSQLRFVLAAPACSACLTALAELVLTVPAPAGLACHFDHRDPRAGAFCGGLWRGAAVRAPPPPGAGGGGPEVIIAPQPPNASLWTLTSRAAPAPTGRYMGAAFQYYAPGGEPLEVLAQGPGGAWAPVWRVPGPAPVWRAADLTFPAAATRVRFAVLGAAAGALALGDVRLRPSACAPRDVRVGPHNASGTAVAAGAVAWCPAVCGPGCWTEAPGNEGAAAAPAPVFAVAVADGRVTVTRTNPSPGAPGWPRAVRLPCVACAESGPCDAPAATSTATTFCDARWVTFGAALWRRVDAAAPGAGPARGPAGAGAYLRAGPGTGTEGLAMNSTEPAAGAEAYLSSAEGVYTAVGFHYLLWGRGGALRVEGVGLDGAVTAVWGRAGPSHAGPHAPWAHATVAFPAPVRAARLVAVAGPDGAAAVGGLRLHVGRGTYAAGEASSGDAAADMAPAGPFVDFQSRVRVQTCPPNVTRLVGAAGEVHISTCAAGVAGVRDYVCGGAVRSLGVVAQAVVEPLQTLRVAQVVNFPDTRHETRWGGPCPGQWLVQCTDEPDTLPHHFANPTAAAVPVYFSVGFVGDTAGCAITVLQWAVAPTAAYVLVAGARSAAELYVNGRHVLSSAGAPFPAAPGSAGHAAALYPALEVNPGDELAVSAVCRTPDPRGCRVLIRLPVAHDGAPAVSSAAWRSSAAAPEDAPAWASPDFNDTAWPPVWATPGPTSLSAASGVTWEARDGAQWIWGPGGAAEAGGRLLLRYAVPVPPCWRVDCPASACRAQGRCDPQTGECVYQAKPDGTPCDDGWYFDFGPDALPAAPTDRCLGGVCTPHRDAVWRAEVGRCVTDAQQQLPSLYRDGVPRAECRRACATTAWCHAFATDATAARRCALYGMLVVPGGGLDARALDAWVLPGWASDGIYQDAVIGARPYGPWPSTCVLWTHLLVLATDVFSPEHVTDARWAPDGARYYVSLSDAGGAPWVLVFAPPLFLPDPDPGWTGLCAIGHGPGGATATANATAITVTWAGDGPGAAGAGARRAEFATPNDCGPWARGDAWHDMQYAEGYGYSYTLSDEGQLRCRLDGDRVQFAGAVQCYAKAGCFETSVLGRMPLAYAPQEPVTVFLSDITDRRVPQPDLQVAPPPRLPLSVGPHCSHRHARVWAVGPASWPFLTTRHRWGVWGGGFLSVYCFFDLL